MIKRLLFFAYGLVSYLIFLATFLYAIAFVGGCPAIPSRLDAPLRTSLPVALAIDCALLMLFALKHSIMARRWFKERWTQIVPWTIERSTFVLCASLALLLLFWQWRPIGIQIWSVDAPGTRAVLWTLFAFGWATVLVVTFLINHFDLFGLRQVWLPLIGKPYTPVSFRRPLPYRLVRHPLYFGFLLGFWVTPTMTLAHLVFALATTAYILIAIQFEERDLVREHGAAYEDYRRSVPMLLPGRRFALKPGGVARRKAHDYTAVGLIVLIGLCPARAVAQDGHSQSSDATVLVELVLESTDRFRDVSVAQSEGYVRQFGCIAGPDAAMGMHLVKPSLVMDGEVESTRPEILLYEPLPNGEVQLVGVAYLVLADAWNARHSAPPQLWGQRFELFDSRNRLGLPAFYTLPVWAWKDNPTGTFASSNPNVSCDPYGG